MESFYEDNYKKALWIPSDLHTEIKIFAAKNNMSIESASQLLLKLCGYEERKVNESE